MGGTGSFLPSLSQLNGRGLPVKEEGREGGGEFTAAEQEYLSGNSHPSFIIDHKEDLIGGSNSWMGLDGGPSQAALMMTSSESERQRLLFISDNRLLVSGGVGVGGGGDWWEKQKQPRATPVFPFHSPLSLSASAVTEL